MKTVDRIDELRNVIIFQKGLSDGQKQVIYNQLEAAQSQVSTKPEEGAGAGVRSKQKKDDVKECVLVEGQIMGKEAYQRKSSLVSVSVDYVLVHDLSNFYNGKRANTFSPKSQYLNSCTVCFLSGTK